MMEDITLNIQLISTIIATYGAYKIAKLKLQPEIKIPVYREQLKNVYLPMFKLLEKDFYKKIDKETTLFYINELEKIIDANYELVDPDIIYYVKTLKEYSSLETKTDEIRHEIFNDLSFKISTTFDSLREQLGMPTRSFTYKYRNYQLAPAIQETCAIIEKIFFFIFLLLMLIFMICMTIYALTEIFSFARNIWLSISAFFASWF